MNDSCRTFEWVMSRIWLSRVAQMHKSCRMCGVASVSRIDKIIGLFFKRALQKRRSFAKETYNFIDPTDCSHPIWTSHVAEMDESCRIHEWVMLHIWTNHVAYVNESCRTYDWGVSHRCVSHVAYINELCCIDRWIMSHIWMSHVAHMTELCHKYEWVLSHIRMSHVAHMNESCRTHEWVAHMN